MINLKKQICTLIGLFILIHNIYSQIATTSILCDTITLASTPRFSIDPNHKPTPENPFSKSQPIIVDPEKVLINLHQAHPRLLLTKDRINEIKTIAIKDTLLASYIAKVVKQADDLLINPTFKGRVRWMHRESLDRILLMGMAYQLTGNRKYATLPIADMLNLCKQTDWRSKQFLDLAEIVTPLAIGYDWFFDCMTDSTKQHIRNCIIEKGLIPGIQAYKGSEEGWFRYVRHNWNQVCNSGLIIGALALAESDPCFAKQIIPFALASAPLALNEYAPDGAYPEGTSYWGFGTTYSVYGMAALQSALKTDFGLSKAKGFDKTCYFSLYTRGPSGVQLTYADQKPYNSRVPDFLFFWFAKQYKDAYLFENERLFLCKSFLFPGPLHVLFYPTFPQKAAKNLPLDRFFNGPVPIVCLRENWTDTLASFIGMKGGYNQVNHGHLDLGNVEINMLGERWLYDLGGERYDLKGYWDFDSTRWTYYRINSKSHNVPMIDGKNQNIYASAFITRTSLNNKNPFAIVDLTDAYKNTCTKVERGIRLLNNRKQILIQDEFEMNESHTVVWGGTTNAIINIDRNTAFLSMNGKIVKAVIVSPQKAIFVQEKAPRLGVGENSTKGINRLLIPLSDVKGKVTISVLFMPTEEASIKSVLKFKELNTWK